MVVTMVVKKRRLDQHERRRCAALAPIAERDDVSGVVTRCSSLRWASGCYRLGRRRVETLASPSPCASAWRVEGSRPAAAEVLPALGYRAQPLQVDDLDFSAVQRDHAGGAQLAQKLRGGLAGGADELGQLLVGQTDAGGSL